MTTLPTYAKFVKGARVRKPLDQELTIIEASFVTLSIAEKMGMSREQWLQFAATAWDRFSETAPAKEPM